MKTNQTQVNNTTRKKSGFTLSEVLISVGILMIAMCIAIPGIVTLWKNMKMMELDNAAKSIYITAQNRMVALQMSGEIEQLTAVSEQNHQTIKLTKTNEDGTDKGSETSNNGESQPTVADPAEPAEPAAPAADEGAATQAAPAADEGTEYYYLVNDNPLVQDILLPLGSIEDNVRLNNYIIEYDPETAMVQSVFYWESGDFSVSKYMIVMKDDSNRARDKRKGDTIEPVGPVGPVGYYAGGDVDRMQGISGAFDPVIVNKDELYVKIPQITSDMLAVEPKSDKSAVENNVKTDENIMSFAESLKSPLDMIPLAMRGVGSSTPLKGAVSIIVTDKATGKSADIVTYRNDSTPISPINLNWTTEGIGNESESYFKLTLDSLKLGMRFKDLYSDFQPGTDLLIKLFFTTENGATVYKELTTNSLFASIEYKSKNEDSGGNAEGELIDPVTGGLTATAKIAYGRHLQNLHKSWSGLSKVTPPDSSAEPSSAPEVTKAKQTKDIEWKTSVTSGAEVIENPTFIPIVNDKLDSFDGAGNIISELKIQYVSKLYESEQEQNEYERIKALFNTDIGMFGVFSGSKLANVRLEDANISIDSTDTVKNVGLLAGKIDNSKATTVEDCRAYLKVDEEKDLKKDCGIYGKDSDVNGNVGGLIGEFDGKAGSKITKSFAALKDINVNSATNIGGLAGSISNVEVTQCYANAGQRDKDAWKNGISISKDAKDNKIGGLLGTASNVKISDCYTAGYAEPNSGTLYGMLADAGNGVDIKNSYSVIIQKPKTENTTENTGNESNNNSTTDNKAIAPELFAPENVSAKNCSRFSDTSGQEKGGVTPKTYKELQESYKDNKNWVKANVKTTKAYGIKTIPTDSEDVNGYDKKQVYPFKRLDGLMHYGDWPEDNTVENDMTIAYYEVYKDGSQYEIGLYSNELEINTLKEDTENHTETTPATVIQDGYVLLVPTDGTNVTVDGISGMPVQATGKDINTSLIYRNSDNNMANVKGAWGSKTPTGYFKTLRQLKYNNVVIDESDVSFNDFKKIGEGDAMIIEKTAKNESEQNSDTKYVPLFLARGFSVAAPVASGGDYYNCFTVKIGSDFTREFYFNPHFAKSLVKIGKAPKKPQEISIRTERHFASLSAYGVYATTMSDVTYNQERDLNWGENANDSGAYTLSYYFDTDISGDKRYTRPEKSVPALSEGVCYNGNEHRLKGLGIGKNTTRLAATFILIGERNIIKNLTIDNSYFTTAGFFNVAALVSQMNGGSLENVSVKNSEIMKAVATDGKDQNTATGGLVGRMQNGQIQEANVNKVKVTGKSKGAGGIVGFMLTGKINESSVSECSVKAESLNGGFVGDMKGGALNICSVENSNVNTDPILGFDKPAYASMTGGIAGQMSNNPQMSNIALRNTQITGRTYTGGIVGYMESGTITDVKVDENNEKIQGYSHIGGIVGCMLKGNISNENEVKNVKLNICEDVPEKINYGNHIGGICGQLTGGDVSRVSLDNVDVSGARLVGGAFGQIVGNQNDSPKINVNGIKLNKVNVNSGGNAYYGSGDQSILNCTAYGTGGFAGGCSVEKAAAQINVGAVTLENINVKLQKSAKDSRENNMLPEPEYHAALFIGSVYKLIQNSSINLNNGNNSSVEIAAGNTVVIDDSDGIEAQSEKSCGVLFGRVNNRQQSGITFPTVSNESEKSTTVTVNNAGADTNVGAFSGYMELNGNCELKDSQVPNAILNVNASGNTSEEGHTGSSVGGVFGTIDNNTTVSTSGNSVSIPGQDVKVNVPGSSVGGFVGKLNGKLNNANLILTPNLNATGDKLNIGGVAGTSNEEMNNVTVELKNVITATGEASDVGGLIGNSSGSVKGTTLTLDGAVTAEGTNSNVGGLIGKSDSFVEQATLNLNSAITAKGEASDVGGLIGEASKGISNSKLTAKAESAGDSNAVAVTGAIGGNTGGFVGNIAAEKTSASIFDSMTTVDVTATNAAAVGGFVGYFNNAHFKECFSGGTVTGSIKSNSGATSNKLGGFTGKYKTGAELETDPVEGIERDLAASDMATILDVLNEAKLINKAAAHKLIDKEQFNIPEKYIEEYNEYCNKYNAYVAAYQAYQTNPTEENHVAFKDAIENMQPLNVADIFKNVPTANNDLYNKAKTIASSKTNIGIDSAAVGEAHSMAGWTNSGTKAGESFLWNIQNHIFTKIQEAKKANNDTEANKYIRILTECTWYVSGNYIYWTNGLIDEAMSKSHEPKYVYRFDKTSSNTEEAIKVITVNGISQILKNSNTYGVQYYGFDGDKLDKLPWSSAVKPGTVYESCAFAYINPGKNYDGDTNNYRDYTKKDHSGAEIGVPGITRLLEGDGTNKTLKPDYSDWKTLL